MKMKKFVLSLVAVAACAGAFRAYESYQQSGESYALLAENVEALSGLEDLVNGFTDYWNSKTHSCREDQCSVTYTFWTFYGTYEQCKDGNKVAHCWDCKSCDA